MLLMWPFQIKDYFFEGSSSSTIGQSIPMISIAIPFSACSTVTKLMTPKYKQKYSSSTH